MRLGQMNVLAIVVLVIIAVTNYLLVTAFFIKLDDSIDKKFFLYIIFWLVLHEVIHALFFIFWDYRKGKKVGMGALLEQGILYCTCKSRISKSNIIAALLGPLLLIGLLTNIVALAIGNRLLLTLSIFNISGAAGDIAMFLALIKMPKDIKYVDLDDPTGFTLLSKSDLSDKQYFGMKLYEKGKDSKELVAKTYKKITITPASYAILIILILLAIVF